MGPANSVVVHSSDLTHFPWRSFARFLVPALGLLVVIVVGSMRMAVEPDPYLLLVLAVAVVGQAYIGVTGGRRMMRHLVRRELAICRVPFAAPDDPTALRLYGHLRPRYHAGADAMVRQLAIVPLAPSGDAVTRQVAERVRRLWWRARLVDVTLALSVVPFGIAQAGYADAMVAQGASVVVVGGPIVVIAVGLGLSRALLNMAVRRQVLRALLAPLDPAVGAGGR